jgi:hypothetical protein
LPPISPEPILLVDDDNDQDGCDDLVFSSVEASEASSDTESSDETFPWYLLSSLVPPSCLLLRLCIDIPDEVSSDKEACLGRLDDGILAELLVFKL